MERHKWLFEEDELCCKTYFRVCKQVDIDTNQVVSLISEQLPNITKNSIRMRLQNIKQLMLEKSVKDNMNIKPLQNYSQQTKMAFEKLFCREL